MEILHFALSPARVSLAESFYGEEKIIEFTLPVQITKDPIKSPSFLIIFMKVTKFESGCFIR